MRNYIEGVLLNRNVESESMILICGHYKTGMCLACPKECQNTVWMVLLEVAMSKIKSESKVKSCQKQRTTHRLGAMFTNTFTKWFTEPANDPWSCVHCSGSCLLSTTSCLCCILISNGIDTLHDNLLLYGRPLLFEVRTWIFTRRCIPENNSISVLSTW